MVSTEGEIVPYLKKIDVNEGDRKGNVEKWMLDVESQMIASLKNAWFMGERGGSVAPNFAEWSQILIVFNTTVFKDEHKVPTLHLFTALSTSARQNVR